MRTLITRSLKITSFIAASLCGLLLLAVSVPLFGFKALSVQTGSMRPNLPPGTLAFVQRTPASTLKVGDIITYASPLLHGETITHRIVAIDRQPGKLAQLTVKGDANQSADPPVSELQLVGRVVFYVPLAGRATDFIRSPLGLVLTVYLPALFVIAYEIKLLVQRLTKLELEKLQPQPAVMDSAPPSGTSPVIKFKKPARRSIDGMVLLAVAVLVLVCIRPTHALLTAQAELTDDNLITAAPNASHLVILSIKFSAPRGSDRSVDPQIVLANPTKQTIDFTGWQLADNSGTFFTFTSQSPLDPKETYDLAPNLTDGLSFSGDRLELKNPAGQIIDAVSWASDTSAFSPSIQGVGAKVKIKRLSKNLDRDLAIDWQLK